jgi:hypothetical protein
MYDYIMQAVSFYINAHQAGFTLLDQFSVKQAALDWALRHNL